MPDYIPSADGEFDAWQSNFVTYATANAAALGLDPVVDIPPLAAAQTTWTTDYAANTAAQATAQAARQAKVAARDSYESVIRPLVGVLQASAAVDDGERAALGITVPDTKPTPVGPPVTRPVVTRNSLGRRRHEVQNQAHDDRTFCQTSDNIQAHPTRGLAASGCRQDRTDNACGQSLNVLEGRRRGHCRRSARGAARRER